jgi:hypothetical protein
MPTLSKPVVTAGSCRPSAVRPGAVRGEGTGSKNCSESSHQPIHLARTGQSRRVNRTKPPKQECERWTAQLSFG